jgi:hypothetical protein
MPVSFAKVEAKNIIEIILSLSASLMRVPVRLYFKINKVYFQFFRQMGVARGYDPELGNMRALYMTLLNYETET